ncbi:hypothetical protein GGR95_002644 [Sulfitobacter undariae]|uniref:Integrase catalytic domain-containing protein n=1 Tax=Sulfitobacter undariae TaxID=1563671 RepID=A0A7W6EC10_9RHOB|nr:DDE-type integrase/transposase/recombinase [Sulfitobacter undariae]MBB3994994.1 hypothetical protein [Sulfitobacter undariae]
MTMEPHYNFQPGTEITLLERPMVVTGQVDNGYRVVGREDGITTVLPFGKLVEQLKLPGAKVDTSLPTTGGRLQQRLGGYATSQALTDEQREYGRFHFAFCQAMLAYRTKIRTENGDPKFELSDRIAGRPEARRFIASVAEQIFGQKILINPGRGGRSKGMYLYQGRTLMKYFRTFESLEPDEAPIDALITLDHLRGNRTSRICNRLRVLMTAAWEEHGLDLKCPPVSNIHKALTANIWQENQKRIANELPELIVPSPRTLREHRDIILTPTEHLIGTKGERQARNERGRGSTDLRALLIGELVEVDECKISLVSSAKEAGFWEKMSVDDKVALEELDTYIKSRFWILVMLDVASRMPLAWVIAENPNSDATLALFRMATRDKTSEKMRYGCSGQPAAAVGLMHVKNDNGTGLRNSATIGALMGTESINTVARTYSPTDKAVVERFFGTLEMNIFKMLPGYTGGRPGELPGYDAKANGVLTVEQLHEIVTKYFIDEYPSTQHYGVGMGGRRPFEVYKSINETRGQIPPIDPHKRRIHLGWEEDVTPTDEGVRVFQGIWFNSDDLQEKREEYRVKGKVKVFIDPGNVNIATVILPGAKEPVEVHLQITAFADMTLPEILKLMAEQRREDPQVTAFHDDIVMRTRLQRYEQIKAIGVEHNLPRSYSTIAECKAMAKAVFAGARVVRSIAQADTTLPGEIAHLEPSRGVYPIGGDEMLIDGVAVPTDAVSFPAPEKTAPRTPSNSNSKSTKAQLRGKQKTSNTTLPRPQNLKDLE